MTRIRPCGTPAELCSSSAPPASSRRAEVCPRGPRPAPRGRRRPPSTRRSSTSTASRATTRTEKEGGLALDAVALQDVSRHPDVWEKVVRKLRARQMPPVGKRPAGRGRPTTRSIASLETSLDRAAAAHPNPGRTATLRRLTRTEYQNAIRDLLALDVDVASLLPADESSYGFDNVTVGDLSPTLLDRYVSAAEKISRLAVGRAEPLAGRRHHPDSAGPHAGGARRGPAARHARRRASSPTRSRWTASTRSRFA